MKASKMLIATLKETPNEAVISSHVLLLRAGMIRKLVAGVYNYLPLGLRVLSKVEAVIREEMDKSGALEMLSSAVQPKELWEESGRWGKYGPELIRFKDRHDREFCLGPTHEEIFTDLVRNVVRSKKNLPLNIYQIQTKYRDEFRPRFGLMRGREFIMKDAYSFDLDEAGLDVSYQNMYRAYSAIFDRLHLDYQVVLADTGAIGGNGSHQFMALSDIGESNIVYCSCSYAADQEKADSRPEPTGAEEERGVLAKTMTPGKKTIDEVSAFLNVEKKRIAKTLVYRDLAHDRFVFVVVLGHREVNPIKVINALGIAEHELIPATGEEIAGLSSVEGFVSPVGISSVQVLIDEEVAESKNLVVGGNEKDVHLENACYGRDFTGTVGQFRKVVAGDCCPICGAPLKMERGIEVGQIFKLGTKYSEPMKCTYQDDDGKVKPMVMGCYGIGITRTISAIVEQNHDENGMIWPVNVAPYHLVIVPVSYLDEMKTVADELYAKLEAMHLEVVLDDRNSKLGFKLKDWDLIGIPYQIIVGKRAGEGFVEWKDRRTNQKTELSLQEALSKAEKEILPYLK